MNPSRLLFSLLLLPLAACSSLTAGEGRVEVRTDPATIEVRRFANELVIDAPVEIVNAGTRSVHIAPCGMGTPLFIVQKRRDHNWENVLYPSCLLVASSSIRLRPGETLHARAWFHTYVDAHSTVGLRPEEVPGTYRVVAAIYHTAFRSSETRPPALLPEEQRASQPFEIAG